MKNQKVYDVAIIGAGLAGLTAAAYLAKAGKSVVVIERSPTLGGRAGSTIHQECRFNFGPHALYRGGGALEILAELGVKFRGTPPEGKGRFIAYKGKLHAFPAGAASLIASRAFALPAKIELGNLLGKLSKLDPVPLNSVPLHDWMQSEIRHPDARQMFSALCRLSTYGNNDVEQSAGAALRQLQIGIAGGVFYIDGGWQTLIGELLRVSTEAGATVLTNRPAVKVRTANGGWNIESADGAQIASNAVIGAIAPKVLEALLDPETRSALDLQPGQTKPNFAACLDLALKSVPKPNHRFVLGVDRPFYFSVHSAWANLGPKTTAVVHAAKYLDPNDPNDARANELELENWLDAIQPGWRAETVFRRFLPKIAVTESSTTAELGGLPGRPSPVVENIPGLYLAGDWAGSRGMLADAALLSAQEAAQFIIQHGPGIRTGEERFAAA